MECRILDNFHIDNSYIICYHFSQNTRLVLAAFCFCYVVKPDSVTVTSGGRKYCALELYGVD